MTAIMQGRLSTPFHGHFQSFPVGTWAQEFPHAALAGVDAIEWIYDTVGEGHNPLETDEGVAAIQALSQEHGIAVRSVCADWFMEHRLAAGLSGERADAVRRLHWLLHRCTRLGVSRVVLPFVDSSGIESRATLDEVARILRAVAPEAAEIGVELHLETSLDAEGFRELLDRVNHACVLVNYDIGNSAALGYLPAEELAAYGHRLGSLHVKDRESGGSTVPLGTGAADFDAVFMALAHLDWTGPVVLQAARSEFGREVEQARADVAFVHRLLQRHSLVRDGLGER